MKRVTSSEEYIASGGDWKESLELLRDPLKPTTLKETVKWGMPAYTFNKE
jgi:hypothetical protein